MPSRAALVLTRVVLVVGVLAGGCTIAPAPSATPDSPPPAAVASPEATGPSAAAGSSSGARSSASVGSGATSSAPPTGGASTGAPTAPGGGSGSTLPATAPSSYRPSRYDVQPGVKLRAAQLIEAIGTWPAGHGGAVEARSRVTALGLDPGLVASGGALLGAADSAKAAVVFAQYGGLTGAAASVLVVVNQVLTAADGSTQQRGTTVDVRLRAHSPRWVVTALHPATPGSPSAHLSAPAKAVLGSSRIHLPAAAAADVRAGLVSDRVLDALLGLVRNHTIDVSVLRSGHPLYVFGTTRRSDNPRGRAVDIWRVDGRPVVDPANRALVVSVMKEGIALGAYQAGGPVLPSASAEYFSDATHHDHIHLGFA